MTPSGSPGVTDLDVQAQPTTALSEHHVVPMCMYSEHRVSDEGPALRKGCTSAHEPQVLTQTTSSTTMPPFSRVKKRNMSMPSLHAGEPVSNNSFHMTPQHRLLDHQTLFRDRTFTEEDWNKHASNWRYLIEPKVLLKVIASLSVPLMLVTSIAVGCAVYEGLRPAHYRSLANLHLTFEYSLVSFALSLLLVFKTNTSYARFWEGVWLRFHPFYPSNAWITPNQRLLHSAQFALRASMEGHFEKWLLNLFKDGGEFSDMIPVL
jgi:hypothetical protein